MCGLCDKIQVSVFKNGFHTFQPLQGGVCFIYAACMQVEVSGVCGVNESFVLYLNVRYTEMSPRLVITVCNFLFNAFVHQHPTPC